MDEIKISVIVPSYNQGAYIENCIKSVIQQDYQNWELIIQDGASQDETIAICEKYASLDKRIVFSTEKDKGFADAVNKALKIVSGTLAVIQSSDDFFAESCVFKDVNEIFNKNKRLHIIAGTSIVVDENLDLLVTQEIAEKYVPIENLYTLRHSFSQGATFFSILRAKQINYLDPEVDMVADTDFWIRMACTKPTLINTIFQTSKIWGAVIVQPQQRSADLTKFFYGRALMAFNHAKNEMLCLSREFKLAQANQLIIAGINHYKAMNKEFEDFTYLFKVLNKKDYVSQKQQITLRSLIKKIVSPKKNELHFNSKEEYYLKNQKNSPKLNMKWFA